MILIKYSILKQFIENFNLKLDSLLYGHTNVKFQNSPCIISVVVGLI